MGDYLPLLAIIGYLALVAGTLSLLTHKGVLTPATAFRVGLMCIAPPLILPFAIDVLARRRTPSGSSDDNTDIQSHQPTTTDDHLTEPEPSYEDDHDDDHPPADSDADTVWLDWHRNGGPSKED